MSWAFIGGTALVSGVSGIIGGIGAKGNKGDVAAGIQSTKDMYANEMEISGRNKDVSTKGLLNQFTTNIGDLFETGKDTMSKIFDYSDKTKVQSNMATIEDPTTPIKKTAYNRYLTDINQQIDTKKLGIEQIDIASVEDKLRATEKRDIGLAEWGEVPKTFWEGFASSFG